MPQTRSSIVGFVDFLPTAYLGIIGGIRRIRELIDKPPVFNNKKEKQAVDEVDKFFIECRIGEFAFCKIGSQHVIASANGTQGGITHDLHSALYGL